jgi:transcriptional regulator with GAF, ATPase, and Fis domain
MGRGGDGRPFVAINCSTIPEGVAERLLFGTRRGAFSGADADAEGYLQMAHGGTLFLDEVADLSLAVQAKLLRVLETREVLPLGGSRPRSIDLCICAASNRPLRDEVAAGRFREDLYFRIGQPEAGLPPLRQRREEIPWLIALELKRAGVRLGMHGSLVEACLLRPWPGNVRELLAAVRTAAHTAGLQGETRLEAKHLSPTAGIALTASSAIVTPSAAATGAPPEAARHAELSAALQAAEGNVSRAARALGVHRNQLCRWLDRYGIDAHAFRPRTAPRSKPGPPASRGK